MQGNRLEAAANSLSDVYAMGGKPLTVMNIVCFPACDLNNNVLSEILAGGLDCRAQRCSEHIILDAYDVEL